MRVRSFASLSVTCLATLQLGSADGLPDLINKQHILTLKNGAPAACTFLSNIFPSQVLFPGSLGYRVQQRHYWLIQQKSDVHPVCRVSPSSAKDLSIIVNAIRAHKAPFAIHSGGHSSVVGASNIDGGITIDLGLLSDIHLDEHNQAIWLGVGATWNQVYRDDRLRCAGLSVAGSRDGAVGVGGFVLGGGFSWHSNRYGWACDTILEFSVVLPNAIIVHASKSSHPDLFWALKGGGSNFGIATHVKVPVFKQPKMYMSQTGYQDKDLNKVLNAITTFTQRSKERDANLFLSMAYIPARRQYSNVVFFVNTGGSTTNSAFADFEALPSLHNVTDVVDMAGLADALDETANAKYRKEKFTLTFRPSAKLMRKVVTIFRSYAQQIDPKSPHRVFMGISLQPLISSHLSTGNNALGFASDSEPLILFSYEVYWEASKDDAWYRGIREKLEHDLRMAAGDMNGLHPFVYLNYAAWWQKPFEGYGEESLRKLKEVRDIYDPDRWYRDHVAGLKF